MCRSEKCQAKKKKKACRPFLRRFQAEIRAFVAAENPGAVCVRACVSKSIKKTGIQMLNSGQQA